MKNIGVVGGGIIGLWSAYFLQQAGFKVTLFDEGNLEDGCSFGNAGMIVPSHFIPLASPGMIAKGVRWMFNSQSPFYVKPRVNRELFDWGFKFYRHATREHVDRSMPALSALSQLSKSLYQKLAASLPFDFGYQERGLLMLFHDASVEKEEMETVHLAHALGIEARPLSLTEIQKMEPDVLVAARGGIYYPGDAHLIPRDLVEKLIAFLRKQGVSFETGTRVNEFVAEGGVIKTIRTNRGEFEADEWVLAAGSWSGQLASELGLSLPMQAGKGYSFTLPDVSRNIRIPTICLEARLAVTPMARALRFGGTMEISGIDHAINMNRVKGIVDSIKKYYPEMTVGLPAKENVWHGLRPCSPDGMPYIGKTKRYTNMIVATGHSMMGLSLGPATGKLVCELMQGEQPSVELGMFDPDRFGGR